MMMKGHELRGPCPCRWANEGAPVAPRQHGNPHEASTDPEKRPLLPREGLSRAVAEAQQWSNSNLTLSSS